MSWYTQPAPGEAPSQGEQLFGLALLRAGRDAQGDPYIARRVADVVILTQSCDLEQRKVEEVLLAPAHSLDVWLQDNPGDFPRLETIRQGYDASLYILPAWREAPYPSARTDRIVDLGSLSTEPLEEVWAACAAGQPRVALASPAREHFGQAVARSFMRVGLPMDVPPFVMESTGRQDTTLLSVFGTDDLLAGRTCTFLQPLPVLILSRRRPSTGDSYVLIQSKQQPQILGAGSTRAAAESSFSRQLVRRFDQASGDERWGWLRSFVQIA